MNTFNQNSEQNLQNRMSSYEFEFDPSAWDDMEQLLDKKKPRGGAAWYFSFPFVAIGVMTLSLAVLVSTFSSNSEQISTTTNVTNTVQSTTVQATNTSNTTESTAIIENPSIINTPQATEATNPVQRKQTVANSTNKTKNTNTIIETASTQFIKTIVPPTKNINKKTVSPKPFFNEQLPIAIPSEKKEIPFTTIKAIEEIKTAPSSPTPVIRYNEKTQEFELLEGKEIPLLEIEEQEEQLNVKKEIAQRKINAGLLVGTGFTTSANGPIKRATISPTIGAFVNYDINDKLSVQVEALVKPIFTSSPLLASKAEDSFSSDTTNVNVAEQYSYVTQELKTIIELPVTVKYNVNKRNAIFAGIRPTLIRTKQKIVSALNSLDRTSSNTSTSDDIALTLGIERQLTKKVSMDVRYSQGLIDQDKDDAKKNLNSDLFLALKYAF